MVKCANCDSPAINYVKYKATAPVAFCPKHMPKNVDAITMRISQGSSTVPPVWNDDVPTQTSTEPTPKKTKKKAAPAPAPVEPEEVAEVAEVAATPAEEVPVVEEPVISDEVAPSESV